MLLGLKTCARAYHGFGLVGTALSKKISVFRSSSLKVAPISPSSSYVAAGMWPLHRVAQGFHHYDMIVDAWVALFINMANLYWWETAHRIYDPEVNSRG